jgi:peptidoglycan/LPS O-acetylase OafA/YrhL
VSSEQERQAVLFEPLRPASRGRVVAALVLGPILWLVALIVAAWVFNHHSRIVLGLLVTVVSFFISLLVLAVVHAARRRQEERYAQRR